MQLTLFTIIFANVKFSIELCSKLDYEALVNFHFQISAMSYKNHHIRTNQSILLIQIKHFALLLTPSVSILC
jgi:hypothetical protein